MNLQEFASRLAEATSNLTPAQHTSVRQLFEAVAARMAENAACGATPAAAADPAREIVERKARIFNIQKYNMYDGPGVRTLVFFKGCPLRCLWCSNPEGQRKEFQVLFKADQCVHCGACVQACPAGVHVFTADGNTHGVDREKECIGCRRCESVCVGKALAIAGDSKGISELLRVVQEDKPFYLTSGGGVTLGGGEALMQPQAAVNLLMACKRDGINTAVETCGYAGLEAVRSVAEFADLFLYDIKHMDPDTHYRLTGVRNDIILRNLKWLLENRCNVKIRMPLLKGVNDDEQALTRVGEFLEPYKHLGNFKGVDLLPYHKMGVHKYAWLGMEYPVEGDPALSSDDLDRIGRIITRHGLPVTLVTH